MLVGLTYMDGACAIILAVSGTTVNELALYLGVSKDKARALLEDLWHNDLLIRFRGENGVMTYALSSVESSDDRPEAAPEAIRTILYLRGPLQTGQMIQLIHEYWGLMWSRQTICKHLKRLESDGRVKVDKSGRHPVYRLAEVGDG